MLVEIYAFRLNRIRATPPPGRTVSGWDPPAARVSRVFQVMALDVYGLMGQLNVY